MKVLIIGAGFGGLALAAYLQRDGHAVTLIERAKDCKREGFVIGLWRNGLHTLEPFGIVEQIRSLSMPVRREWIRHKSGTMLAQIDYQPLLERYGEVFLLPHAALQMLLRELVHDVPIRFQTTLVDVVEDEEGVHVSLSDGMRETFDLVVGADGTHSHTRELLFGNEGVSYAGLRFWLTMLPAGPDVPLEPNDLFGEGEYIGVFPRQDGRMGVLFLARVPEAELDVAVEHIAYLRKRFADFGWIIPSVLQSLHDPATIFMDEVYQVRLSTWYRGHVVLLGDAAHAVSPTAAMGGAMALEDAHVLAEELREVDTQRVEAALAAYMARRKPRVAELRHTSDFLIWLASVEYPAVALVRNTVMHLLPPAMLLQGMEPMLETLA